MQDNNNANGNGKRRQRTNQDQVGEGNRDADRRYRKATEEYVESGRADSAGKEARRAIDDETQRREMEEAERRGRDTGPKAPEPGQDNKR